MATRNLSFGVDDDDVTYENYAETTVDPGYTLLFVAVGICIGSLASLPLLVRLAKRALGKKHGDDDAAARNATASVSSGYLNAIGGDVSGLLRQWWAVATLDVDGIDVEKTYAIDDMIAAYVDREQLPEIEGGDDGGGGALVPAQRPLGRQSPARGLARRRRYSSKSKRWGRERARSLSKRIVDTLRPIAKYDHETERILRLAVPFTISALIGTISEIIVLAIISHHLSTNAM